MFRCAVTGKVSAPGEPAHRVVIERRARTYAADKHHAVESKGWEIVREVLVTAEGLKQLSMRQLAT